MSQESEPGIGTGNQRSKFNWFWPEINDTESAAKASKEGVWACVIIATITTLVIVYGQITGRFILGTDIWSLIEVCIYLVFAWFIQYRKNRAVALFGMLFFVLSNLSMRVANLQTSGILITLTLTLMWVNSIRGTFAYHRFRAAVAQQKDESVKPSIKRRVGIGAAVLIVIGFVGLVVIGTMGPPVGVVTWEELDPIHKQTLNESGLLTDESRVLFLYSTSLMDIREDLYALTENAVVIHDTVDGERQHWVVPLDTIIALRVVYSESWLEDTELVVEDRDYLNLVPLSTESGRDREFVARLEQLTGLEAIEIEVDESE